MASVTISRETAALAQHGLERLVEDLTRDLERARANGAADLASREYVLREYRAALAELTTATQNAT